MFTPDRNLDPPITDSEDFILCDKCGKEHSVDNSNQVVVMREEGNGYEQWCNGCVNEYK